MKQGIRTIVPVNYDFESSKKLWYFNSNYFATFSKNATSYIQVPSKTVSHLIKSFALIIILEGI